MWVHVWCKLWNELRLRYFSWHHCTIAQNIYDNNTYILCIFKKYFDPFPFQTTNKKVRIAHSSDFTSLLSLAFTFHIQYGLNICPKNEKFLFLLKELGKINIVFWTKNGLRKAACHHCISIYWNGYFRVEPWLKYIQRKYALGLTLLT